MFANYVYLNLSSSIVKISCVNTDNHLAQSGMDSVIASVLVKRVVTLAIQNTAISLSAGALVQFSKRSEKPFIWKDEAAASFT